MVRDRFATAGIETPALDARLLAERAFCLDAAALVAAERDPALPEPMQRFDDLATRRLAGEPVARILGEKGFYGLTFTLNAATLVPRPETELLVEMALQRIISVQTPRALDLGTGSGCIAVSLAASNPAVETVAVDIDADALDAARANSVRHGVGERIAFRRGSWFAPLAAGERFDLVVSNPPYIESAAIAGLRAEVRDHDPLTALDGGPDGLSCYRIIAAGAPRFLRPGGAVIVEIGHDQAEAVCALFTAAGFKPVEVEKDLAGHDRAVLAVN